MCACFESVFVPRNISLECSHLLNLINNREVFFGSNSLKLLSESMTFLSQHDVFITA